MLLLFVLLLIGICQNETLEKTPIAQCAEDVSKFKTDADCKNEKDEIIGKLYGFEFDVSGCCYLKCKVGTKEADDYKEMMIVVNEKQPETCEMIKDVPKPGETKVIEKDCPDVDLSGAEGISDDDIIIDFDDDGWEYYLD